MMRAIVLHITGLGNHQGVMLGECSRNIWFDDFVSGDGSKIEIITISNSD
jgi:hypothetical protein